MHAYIVDVHVRVARVPMHVPTTAYEELYIRAFCWARIGGQ
jgi:hypothetical protein